MRWIAAAFLVFAGFATPALAQAPGAAAAVTPDRVDAARTAINAMIIESGSLQNGTHLAFTRLLPQTRQSFQDGILQTTTPARRQAVLVYLDTFADIATAEVINAFPVVADQYAPRVASLFTVEELNDITAFVRTEHGRSFFVRGVEMGVVDSTGGASAPATFTDEELTALAEFGTTAGGRAWNANADAFNAALGEIGGRAVSNVADRIRARIFRDVCERLESDCPPEMRTEGAAYQP